METQTFTVKARLIRYDFDHYTYMGSPVYNVYALTDEETLWIAQTKAGAGWLYKLTASNLKKEFIFTLVRKYGSVKVRCTGMALTEKEVNKIVGAYND